MPTHTMNLITGDQFEVEVIPVPDNALDVERRLLALSHISPIRSLSSLQPFDSPGSISTSRHYYDPIELKRALVDDTYLFDWRQNWHAGNRDYRDVLIRPLARDTHEPHWQWKLTNCWPHLWEGPAFNAMQSDILYERIELYFQELEWISA